MFSLWSSYMNSCKINNYVTSNYEKIRDLKLSPNGNSFAFRIKENWLYYVIKDGAKSKWYKSISKLMYSPNGNNFFYKIRKDNWKYTLVINWKQISWEYDRIYDVFFSPDGERYWFIADKNWKQFAIVDWKESWPYEYINTIIFSQDSKKYAILVTENNLTKVVYNGSYYWKSYKNITWLWFKSNNPIILAKVWDNYITYDNWNEKTYTNVIKTVYSNYRNSFALVLGNGDNTVIEDWSKVGTTYSNLYEIKYFGDHLVFRAWKKFKVLLDIDWKDTKLYDNVFLPIFSKDFKSYIYITKENWKSWLYKDWIKIWLYDDIPIKIISPNGKKYAYLAVVNNKKIIYKNWKKIWEFSNVNILKYSKFNDLFFVYKDNSSNLKIYFNWKYYNLWDIQASKFTLWKTKYAYISDNNIYENWKKIINLVWDIKDLFFVWDNLYVEWTFNSMYGIYFISCNNKNYIDEKLKNKYIWLIKNRLGKKIKKISQKRRLFIAQKVDLIITKIKHNNKYTEDIKIKKITLFTAFKEVIVDFSW